MMSSKGLTYVAELSTSLISKPNKSINDLTENFPYTGSLKFLVVI